MSTAIASTTTITTREDAVLCEIEIAAPPDRVFQALTQPGELMRWWTSEACRAELWEMDARSGGRWRSRLRSETMPANGTKVFEANGEILEIDPPRLLVYTWITNWDPQPASRSVVRWELAAAANGTKLRMTHSSLTPELAKGYSGGWPDVVGRLKSFAEK